MAGSIRFFRFIQKSYYTVGIRPLSSQNKWFGSYNWRNSIVLLFLSIMFVASTAFLLFQANSFEEYGTAFYVSVTELVNIVCLIAIIPKMTDIFALMEKFGDFVEKSK